MVPASSFAFSSQLGQRFPGWRQASSITDNGHLRPPLIAVLSHNATMSAVAARCNTRASQHAQTDANQPSVVKRKKLFLSGNDAEMGGPAGVSAETPALGCICRRAVVGQDTGQAEGSQRVRLEPGEAGNLVAAQGAD